MKSYTEATGLLQSLSHTATTDTTNTALLVQLWNDSIRTMCSIRGGKWRFLETIMTVNTVASQQGYQVPANIRKIIDLYITVGTQKYLPRPIFNPEQWNRFLSLNFAVSDVPFVYYPQGTQFLIGPTPASSSNPITIRGRLNVRDLSIADYTTGTIASIANGATTVTGGGTSWTSQMAGRYIKITNTNSTNTGDGFWYLIASVTSGTVLELTAPYNGSPISAATAAYKIGEMSPIPDAYDMGPIYRAIAIYTQTNDPLHPENSKRWWMLYDGGQEMGFAALPGGLVGQMLQTEGETVEGAYISPNDMNGQAWPPYWLPFQDATGF